MVRQGSLSLYIRLHRAQGSAGRIALKHVPPQLDDVRIGLVFRVVRLVPWFVVRVVNYERLVRGPQLRVVQLDALLQVECRRQRLPAVLRWPGRDTGEHSTQQNNINNLG